MCLGTAIASPGQIFTTLVDFELNNGYEPTSLVQGMDGNFYGTTGAGGTNRSGTVFKISSGGAVTTLHNFASSDGEGPYAALALATDGNFYGTTEGGGGNTVCNGFGCGTVFKITPGGALTTLHDFNGTDGSVPTGGLIQATNGSFYGTTQNDGANGGGTVFKITAGGTFTTLHDFDFADGYSPHAGLIQGRDGTFYGTTFYGGAYSYGTVFRITAGGTLTTLHNFNSTDGANPWAGLVQALDGNFYGTTGSGGSTYCDGRGCGSAFKITPGGTLTTLHAFDNIDGSGPRAGLIQATDGNFYGTTFAGGGSGFNCSGLGCGTVFGIALGATFATLHSFDSTDGSWPVGGLVQATNGNFYGTTGNGGDITCDPSFGCGTVFSLDMGLGPFVAFVRNSGKVGQTGGILGQGFTGTTSVSLNGIPAAFTVKSDTYITATVPPGATTGFVTVVTPSGTLTSNVPFRVLP
jgi:uncharacterized repeat protein (TIGR03803 family)